MKTNDLSSDIAPAKLLPKDFNKKKFNISYAVTTDPYLQEIQNLSRSQCMGKKVWQPISQIKGWMVSAETATFMKWGGLGMIATELPEAFNKCFADKGEKNDERSHPSTERTQIHPRL